MVTAIPRATCVCLNLNSLKLKLKFSFPVPLATFQVPSNHTWLLSPAMDRTDIHHFHHHRKCLGSNGLGCHAGSGDSTSRVKSEWGVRRKGGWTGHSDKWNLATLYSCGFYLRNFEICIKIHSSQGHCKISTRCVTQFTTIFLFNIGKYHNR